MSENSPQGVKLFSGPAGGWEALAAVAQAVRNEMEALSRAHGARPAGRNAAGDDRQCGVPSYKSIPVKLRTHRAAAG
ncbi:hypothetical protein GBB76_10405 [Ancylobacter sp. TS-1]|nr:hypothetical protein GBB76_10405 [Ancylobacter sp. TS-1]